MSEDVDNKAVGASAKRDVSRRKSSPKASLENSSSNLLGELPLTGTAGERMVQALSEAVQHQVNINQLLAMHGRSESLTIGRIDLNETGAERVDIHGLRTRISCGSAVLENVRAILELTFTAHWAYDLKWLGSDSGVKELGQKANTVSLHDIELPMLEDFIFDVDEVELEDVDVAIDSLQDVQLGGSEFDAVRARRTAAPAEGFSLVDLDLGRLEISGVQVPATRTDEVHIAGFRPSQALHLPSVSLGPISVPAIEIDDVQSQGAVSVMGAVLESIVAPVFKIGDLFKVKLVVDPVLHLQIGNVRLADLRASADVQSVAVSDIQSRLQVQDVTIRDLSLEELSIDQTEIA